MQRFAKKRTLEYESVNHNNFIYNNFAFINIQCFNNSSNFSKKWYKCEHRIYCFISYVIVVRSYICNCYILRHNIKRNRKRNNSFYYSQNKQKFFRCWKIPGLEYFIFINYRYCLFYNIPIWHYIYANLHPLICRILLVCVNIVFWVLCRTLSKHFIAGR